MSLKTQATWRYRGLVWVGRLYYFLGWIGLALSPLVTFSRYVEDSHYWEQLGIFDIFLPDPPPEAYTETLIFMLVFFGGSALAFAISLGIQVGLALMKNSAIKIDLLRRIAQQQSEQASPLQATVVQAPDDREEIVQPMLQRRR